VISGTPTTAQTRSFTVRVADTGGQSDTQSLGITISATPQRTLTVTGAMNGNGRVTSAPPGIDCQIAATNESGVCAADFDVGTNVTLSPAAEVGHVFVEWFGACTRSDTCTVEMDVDRRVDVAFAPKLRITTSSLPDGQVGQGYSQALNATGGLGTRTWTLTGGTIPPGLGLSGTGTIGGLPASPGTWAFTVRVEDTTGQSDTRDLGITVRPREFELRVDGIAAGNGRVESSPPGINCEMTGTTESGNCTASFEEGMNVSLFPTAATGYVFVEWLGDCSGPGACTLQMNNPKQVGVAFVQQLKITTTSLPAGLVGQVYSHTLQATGGTGRVWSIANGSLPAGLSLSSSGVISGTPTVAGASSFTVRVEDGSGQSDTRSLSLTVEPRRFNLQVVGNGNGDGRVTSSPPGIECDISGTDESGSCMFSFVEGTTVTLGPLAGGGSVFMGWSGACTGTAPCSVTMTEPRGVSARFDHILRITTAVLPSGHVAAAYSARLEAAGGYGEQTWTTSSGSLPPGLNLATTGLIDGTPTTEGTWSFTARVQDIGGQVATRNLSISIGPRQFPLSIQGSGTGSGRVEAGGGAINCVINAGVRTGSCYAQFDEGTILLMARVPETGSVFAGWTGACSGTGPCEVSMTEPRGLVAQFDLIP
jgi:Fe-S cluster biogenesis protein NfuA